MQLPDLEPHVWAAIMSAIAASCSAASAIGVLLIQRKNRLDAARPEIVFEGWSRDGQNPKADESETFTIQSIRNAGPGGALGVHINLIEAFDHDKPLVAVMGTIHLSFIPAGSVVNVGEQIRAYWRNATSVGNLRVLTFTLQTYCWDSVGYRYITRESFFVHDLRTARFTPASGDFPEGFQPTMRVVTRGPVWVAKLKQLREKMRQPIPWKR